MFTSAELPMHGGAQAPQGADPFTVWDDVNDSPRVSHRLALAFIIGASLGSYTLIYAMGSLATHLLAGI